MKIIFTANLMMILMVTSMMILMMEMVTKPNDDDDYDSDYGDRDHRDAVDE